MRKMFLSKIASIYLSQYNKLHLILMHYKEKNILEREIDECTYEANKFTLSLRNINEAVIIEKYDVIVKEEQVSLPVLRTLEQSFYNKKFKKMNYYCYEIVIPKIKMNNEKKFVDDIRSYVGKYSVRKYGSYLIEN